MINEEVKLNMVNAQYSTMKLMKKFIDFFFEGNVIAYFMVMVSGAEP